MMTVRTASQYAFPSSTQLCDLPDDGLVGIGADLAPATLLAAYQHGIFPWFNPDEDIAWWSPNPRCVMYTADYRMAKSLLRQCRKGQYTLTVNRAFSWVVSACSQPRRQSADTWISQPIIDGYTALHQAGFAYSIEVWENNAIGRLDGLVGGLYGVCIGAGLFGESMFSRRSDVSKMAFALLMLLACQQQVPWVDCQLVNSHLTSLGAVAISRSLFLTTLLPEQLAKPMLPWHTLSKLEISDIQLADVLR